MEPEDQKKIVAAWKSGEVAPEDIPESAKGGDGEEDEPVKKKGRAKKDAGEAKEKAPPKKRAKVCLISTFN